MLKEAKDSYPYECCGLLAGSNNSRKVVRKIYPVENKNKVRAGDRYEIDPKRFDEIDREATKKGLIITGIYHSHPDHPAEPSDFDKECAYVWTEYSYIIISVRDGIDEEIRSWCFNPHKKKFEEEALKINRRDFIIGISLIIFSFLLYFCLFFIPFSSLSKKAMVGSATAGWLSSWGLTGIGIYFVSKEGYEYIKQAVLKGFFKKMIGKKKNE